MSAATAGVRAERRRDVYDVIWEVLTSVRLAIAIVVVLAVASLIGALLIQPVQTVDPRLLADPAQREAFLEFARDRYGFLGGALAPPWLRDLTVLGLDRLGLFDVFNAGWFRVLLLVLAASVTMCTLNRLEPVWQTIRHPLVRRSDHHYAISKARRAVAGSSPEALRTVLTRRRYKLFEARDPDGTVHLHGDRNSWARGGTLASHLALLILLVSGAVGTLFGFEVDLAIPTGESLPVFPVGTTDNITVRNLGFVATFDERGLPTDFYSDLVLLQGGREVARQRVYVNEPLRYGGLRFHQSSFGPAVDIELRDAATGQVVVSEVIRFFEAFEDVPVDLRPIADRQERLLIAMPPRDPPLLAVQVLEGTTGVFPLGIATVREGETARVGPYDLTLRAFDTYTVIRVVRSSGEWLLWVAGALFLGGMAATFYWPRSRVWARLRDDQAVMTLQADRTFDSDAELDRLSEGMSKWSG